MYDYVYMGNDVQYGFIIECGKRVSCVYSLHASEGYPLSMTFTLLRISNSANMYIVVYRSQFKAQEWFGFWIFLSTLMTLKRNLLQGLEYFKQIFTQKQSKGQ